MCAIKGIDLDAPMERVTADEWIDAHHTEQLAAEADRDITEADLEDPLGAAAESDFGDGQPHDSLQVVESPPLDIRETALLDRGELHDAAERRRIPAPDETAATVGRAGLVVAEISNHQAANDAAHHAVDPPDNGDSYDDVVDRGHPQPVEMESSPIDDDALAR